ISGIMFTVNPVTNDKTKIIVETIWGLGEYIVQGKITPDQHVIDKNTWVVASSSQTDQDVELVRAPTKPKRSPSPSPNSTLPKSTMLLP
ncbi:MAG TPA: PEP/pyruvate-binding domain-containing protein, partial [Patescibacteria group bacterium]